MSKEEAQRIISDEIKPYRDRGYHELAKLIDQEPYTKEVVGSSGQEYQIEIEAFWDEKPNEDIRVLGSIDDSPSKSIFWKWPILRWIPIYGTLASEDFIISPSGEFVDE